MARLQVDWNEASLAGGYEGYNPSDLFTALPDEVGKSGKPLVVYLTSDLEDDAQETELATAALADEKVALGLKMFHAVKVDGSRITRDHAYADILGGRELPRLVVVGADGKKVGSTEGKVSASEVYSLMKRAASRVYKTQIDSYIKDYQKVLTEIDKIESAKKVLATQRETSGNVSKSKAAKWDREEAEMAKKESELLDQEKELLAFNRRDGGKVAAASSGP